MRWEQIRTPGEREEKNGEEGGVGVGIDVVKGKGEKRKEKARARNCNNVAIDTLDFCFANFSFRKCFMPYTYATSKLHNLLDDDIDVPVSKVSSDACTHRQVGGRKSNKFSFDIKNSIDTYN